MRNIRRIGLGIIAVVLLGSPLAAAPGGLTKDIIIRGHVEGTVQATPAGVVYFQGVDIGVTSHAGRHYNMLTSVVQPDGTGASQGIWVGANGDRLVWTGVIAGSDLTVTIQSGTGQYKGATGGFTGTMSNLELVVDPGTGKGTLSYDYRGEGAVKLMPAADRISDLARPFKVKGIMTLTPRADGKIDVLDVGQATYLGNFRNTGVITVNALGLITEGAGQVVGANGDALDWHIQPLSDRCIFDGASEGRFEGAIGYFDSTTTSLTFDANGVGTVVYFGTGEITFAR